MLSKDRCLPSFASIDGHPIKDEINAANGRLLDLGAAFRGEAPLSGIAEAHRLSLNAQILCPLVLKFIRSKRFSYPRRNNMCFSAFQGIPPHKLEGILLLMITDFIIAVCFLSIHSH